MASNDPIGQDQPPTPMEDLRAAFVAGALWADDSCPVHHYPSLVHAEAETRYPQEDTMQKVTTSVAVFTPHQQSQEAQ